VTDESSPLLEVTDLGVTFAARRGLIPGVGRHEGDVRAVDGVSLQLRAGEMLALVGESGSGKTTTLQTILGMQQSTAGRVRIKGRELSEMRPRELRRLRRDVQVVYQDAYESLDPRFNVRRTVAEPLLVHRLHRRRADREEAVRTALERAGLTPPELYLDRYPHELSGGQRQRVAIAASLVLNPELLLADEPVSMLDVSVRAGILALLDQLRGSGEMGVLMITHDLSTAAQFADHIAVMYLGRIVEYGTARDVIDEPQHPYTKALLSVVPHADPRRRTEGMILQGETPNPRDTPAGCRFHPRCPVVQERCRELDPQLAPIDGGADTHRAACVLTGAAG
jgi:oligopeptide/dipeptide ABC transporter ATP-binding protein